MRAGQKPNLLTFFWKSCLDNLEERLNKVPSRDQTEWQSNGALAWFTVRGSPWYFDSFVGNLKMPPWCSRSNESSFGEPWALCGPLAASVWGVVCCYPSLHCWGPPCSFRHTRRICGCNSGKKLDRGDDNKGNWQRVNMVATHYQHLPWELWKSLLLRPFGINRLGCFAEESMHRLTFPRVCIWCAQTAPTSQEHVATACVGTQSTLGFFFQLFILK